MAPRLVFASSPSFWYARNAHLGESAALSWKHLYVELAGRCLCWTRMRGRGKGPCPNERQDS